MANRPTHRDLLLGHCVEHALDDALHVAALLVVVDFNDHAPVVADLQASNRQASAAQSGDRQADRQDSLAYSDALLGA